MNDYIIENAINYIQDLFRNNPGGHDPEHMMRVYRNTLLIAEYEPDCDIQIASLAALLHDADDHKLFDSDDHLNARTFLRENQVPQQTIDRICHVIDSVSFSQNRGRIPDTLEGKVVQDADRLDAMGAVGVARAFAYGGQHGRSMQESVQHFYDKLLHLNNMINTETGKKLAVRRHEFLLQFLKEYLEDIG